MRSVPRSANVVRMETENPTHTPTLRDVLLARARFLALMAVLFAIVGLFGQWIGIDDYRIWTVSQ